MAAAATSSGIPSFALIRGFQVLESSSSPPVFVVCVDSADRKREDTLVNLAPDTPTSGDYAAKVNRWGASREDGDFERGGGEHHRPACHSIRNQLPSGRSMNGAGRRLRLARLLLS